MAKYREMFWGSSAEACKTQAEILHQLLDDAMNQHSGLQQPDHPMDEAHAERCAADRIQHKKEFKASIAKIAGAFGFRLR